MTRRIRSAAVCFLALGLALSAGRFPFDSARRFKMLKPPKGGFVSVRRRSESNRLVKVLQTSPFPLGYGAIR